MMCFVLESLCVLLEYISELCKNCTGRILEGRGRILKGTGLLNHCQPVCHGSWELNIFCSVTAIKFKLRRANHVIR